MPAAVKIHYDNRLGYADPHLWVWYDGSTRREDVAPCDSDDFGVVFELTVLHPTFRFKFKDGPGTDGPWEGGDLDRLHRPFKPIGAVSSGEFWCTAGNAFLYPVAPRAAQSESAADFLARLRYKPGMYIPGTGGFSGLGANLLADGRCLFGLYHPNAARVYLMGSFNDWQRPTHDRADPARFIELKRYRGYFGLPNLWLGIVEGVAAGDEYKFAVLGGVPSDEKGRFQQYLTDAYARQLGPDFGFNNAAVVDPTCAADILRLNRLDVAVDQRLDLDLGLVR